jgi:hypothetical protein
MEADAGRDRTEKEIPAHRVRGVQPAVTVPLALIAEKLEMFRVLRRMLF